MLLLRGQPLKIPDERRISMRQRNHALTLRLNDEELKHLKDQVVASGLTTQTFLRLLIAGQKIKPRRPEVFIDLLHELSAIGNNINQIPVLPTSAAMSANLIWMKSKRCSREFGRR